MSRARFVTVADLEEDLSTLRQWLHKVEGQVVPLTIKVSWTVDDLQQKLRQHEVSEGRFVSGSRFCRVSM